MSAPDEVVLQTRELRKAFGGVIALDGVDLSVRRGEIRALIGPNGAGKTTLINVVTGLWPPTAGRVWLDGAEITGLPAEKIARRGLARTFQRTTIFGGCATVDNVLVACAATRRFRGLDASAGSLGEEAREILEQVGLTEDGAVTASSLSHGDQRLLEVAVAVAMRPAVLLLDEPTAGMSAAETHRTVSVIKALKGTTTIVIVEHDMDVIMEVSDVITVLASGRVIAEGDPAAIQSDEQVREVYLGR